MKPAISNGVGEFALVALLILWALYELGVLR